MSKVGGYIILNLKDTPLVASAASGTTIAGTYDILQAAMRNRKAVLVSGINVAPVDGEVSVAVAYPDTFGAAWVNAENTISVRCFINGVAAQVHVSNDDGVTVELA